MSDSDSETIEKSPKNTSPEHLKIEKVMITLHIDTGNRLYDEFDNIEDALEFVMTYYQNPQAIRDKITPRKRPKKDG